MRKRLQNYVTSFSVQFTFASKFSQFCKFLFLFGTPRKAFLLMTSRLFERVRVTRVGLITTEQIDLELFQENYDLPRMFQKRVFPQL